MAERLRRELFKDRSRTFAGLRIVGRSPGLWHVQPSGRRKLLEPQPDVNVGQDRLVWMVSRRGLWLELVIQVFDVMARELRISLCLMDRAIFHSYAGLHSNGLGPLLPVPGLHRRSRSCLVHIALAVPCIGARPGSYED